MALESIWLERAVVLRLQFSHEDQTQTSGWLDGSQAARSSQNLHVKRESLGAIRSPGSKDVHFWLGAKVSLVHEPQLINGGGVPLQK